MRKFTQEERQFIMENEQKYSLERLAKLFHCTWQEIYEAYSDTFENGEHKIYMFNEYCKQLQTQLKHARSYSNSYATFEYKLEVLPNMTAPEIDKAIETAIQNLITSLKNFKRRLHENFSNINEVEK